MKSSCVLLEPFLCLRCRERTEASNFNEALYEHTQYLRRKKEAQERREAYESTNDDGDTVAGSSQLDLSLKPGETITLKLAKVSCAGLHGAALHCRP